MTDQCKHCQLRGNLKACMAIECSKHEDWYSQQLQQQNSKLTADNAALVEALEAAKIEMFGFAHSKRDFIDTVIEPLLKQAKGDV